MCVLCYHYLFSVQLITRFRPTLFQCVQHSAEKDCSLRDNNDINKCKAADNLNSHGKKFLAIFVCQRKVICVLHLFCALRRTLRLASIGAGVG